MVQQQTSPPSQSPTQSVPNPTPEPTPAPQTMIALHFEGTMTIGGANGTFSYTLEDAPIKTNVGNQTNAVYKPSHWNFLVTSNREDLLPTKTFADTIEGQIGELCVGLCLLSPRQMAVLSLKEPSSGLLFQFAFELVQPKTSPPTFTQIGAYIQAVYRYDGGTPLALFNDDGTLTESATPM